MQSVVIHDLLAMGTKRIIQKVNEENIDKIDIVFVDGVTITSTGRELIYSSYFWNLLVAYPRTPATSKHHVQSVLKGRPLTSSTHMELLGIIAKDIIKYNNLFTPERRNRS